MFNASKTDPAAWVACITGVGKKTITVQYPFHDTGDETHKVSSGRYSPTAPLLSHSDIITTHAYLHVRWHMIRPLSSSLHPEVPRIPCVSQLCWNLLPCGVLVLRCQGIRY